MSHVVSLAVKVKSLAALKLACKEVGLEFMEGQTSYKWFGRSVGDYALPKGFTAQDLGKCVHALKVPGKATAYEIGVVPSKDGKGFELLFDFWMNGYGLMEVVGPNATKLIQAYSKSVIKRENKELVEEEGWTVQTKTLSNGKIQVIYDDGN